MAAPRYVATDGSDPRIEANPEPFDTLMKITTVLLVDDHVLFRTGFKALIEASGGFQVVGEASDARDAYQLDEAVKPELVLMDIRLPGTDGIAATRELIRRNDRRPVVMLSALDAADVVVDALQAGASGFLSKSQPMDEAAEGLRKILRGYTYVPPMLEAVVSDLGARLERKHTVHSYGTLSAREREVFGMLIRGRSNSQVAHELCISVKTVESHREHILKKLSMHSVVELVRFAARNQLLD